ncbi:MAG: alpha-L-fucosidase [Phycisphaerae bacterium]|jgi:alpha-L-fucosidase
MSKRWWLAMAFLLLAGGLCRAQTTKSEVPSMPTETRAERDARMAWWREARFGMFIHWGLYAIPAGRWGDNTNHAEWIMNTAHIPVERYEQFRSEFNPVQFDATEWVRMAQDAGMKYIVITSKHHDGFCLFDSAYTDYDVMSTPFRRDIMKELSDACRAAGLKMCWYHSIMDWHHPDYLPRRGWEQRSAEGADFDRFVTYLKSEVRELLTKYGPIGVMWFDGEWENTWNHERGLDLYRYVRELQPDIIVNNRVDKGRAGMAGMTTDERFAGDFGTPEQAIPATGLPGVDWETCMTMNNHWGYNAYDHNWKSTADLIRKLVDIASKGGNFLLNVGPRADGTFPPEAVERLREIGAWMKVNGESIYGTTASPFKHLPWGRCTMRCLPTRRLKCFVYLHVFDWPKDGKLVVPGLQNEPFVVRLLADPQGPPLEVSREAGALVIDVPREAPDPIDSVVVLQIWDGPRVIEPPTIATEADIFVDALAVVIEPGSRDVEIRYTLDGSLPTADSPVVGGPVFIAETCTVVAQHFRDGQPVSGAARATFTKVEPRPAETEAGATSGLQYEYYEGKWDVLPDFDTLNAVKTGRVDNFTYAPRNRPDGFAFRYRGYVAVPDDGVYTFSTVSDDGSRLYIGDQLVVNNDGPHSAFERSGQIALAAGLHPITVTFFERTGDDALEVWWAGPGIPRERIPDAALSAPASSEAQSTGVPGLARPTPAQIAWQDCELGMFIHFAPNTWLDREYDDLALPLERFNPAELNTDQWVHAAKVMGAQYIIIVAKHAGGFCLWPTETTDYSVKSTPWRDGQGDVLADLADSCRRWDMKLGVYISPTDRRHGAGGGGRCETEAEQQAYNEVYRRQLTEVLSRYGPMYEVWFDGSIVVPVADILKKYAPDAMVFQGPQATIRWVGNEDGVAPYPAWNSVSAEAARTGTATAADGDPAGTVWLPNECDARMRNTWFWRRDNAETLKTVDQLMDMYYKSVGRGAVLLVNHTPDTTGLIPEADVRRGAEFGAELRQRFGKSLAEAAGKGETLELTFGKPTKVDHVVMQEDIAGGERVRAYVIEGRVGDEWQVLAEGSAIGHKRMDRFELCEVSAIRLRVTQAVGEPLIRRCAAYCVGK